MGPGLGHRWWSIATVGLLVLGCGTSDRISDGISGAGAVACTDDGGLPADAGLAAGASLASGTFTSPDVRATICRGGAIAHLQAGMVEIINTYYGQAGSRFQFQEPTDAAYGELLAYVYVDALAPGRYQSADACGSVSFATYLPVPASLDCQAVPPDGMVCPPGCALEGPVSALSCMPLMPLIDYQAGSSMSCDYALPDEGSFTLSLTSVAPDAQSGINVVHGSLTAQLVGGGGDAGTSMGTLQLEF